MMSSIQSITVLAQASAVPAARETSAVEVVVVGFLFVVVVLALLSAVTSAMGAFFAKQAANSAAKAADAAKAAAESISADRPQAGLSSPVPACESSQTEDEAEMMAVIAAAVHTVIGDRPHRVVSVRSAGPGWAQEGRRQIFSSHRVR